MMLFRSPRLPDVGVTSIRETWTTSCEDITSALASFQESLQVATSPYCWWDLPDVISANPSLSAWAPVTAVPWSASACFFLHVIGLPPYTIEVGFPRFPVKTIS
jgi:hypothetical protein